jgi:ribosomal protein L16/L10AE
VVKKGRLLFETRSSSVDLARGTLSSARVKLPLKTKVAEKGHNTTA